MIVSRYDAPNTTAIISLPYGAELANGYSSGSWNLTANVPVYLNASIRFNRTGDFRIEALASRKVDSDNSWGDLDVLYLTIGVSQSMFTLGPVFWGSSAQSTAGNATVIEANAAMSPITEAMEQNMPSAQEIPSIAPSRLIDAGSASSPDPNSPDSLTVTGRYQYWTQLADYRPDPDTYDWAREVLVEVVRASDGAHLGWGYTDLEGCFSIIIENPGSAGFRVINYAYTSYNPPASSPELRVVSSDAGGTTGLDYVWRWTTESTFVAPDGVTDVGTWHPIENYEACWLHSDLQRSWRFVWFYNDGHFDAGQGTIVWYQTSKDGTYYHFGGQIHLKGEDARSSDTSIHEYGHNVMYNKYGQWFPQTYCPSPHYMDSNEHVNCAWTEGWADYFPLVVNGNPTYTWASGAGLNLETPTWGTPNWDDGDGVEGRVAGALWDIYDEMVDGCDAYCFGFNPIEMIVFNNRQTNFREFWDQWQSSGYSNNAVRCLFQNTIYYGSNIWCCLGGYSTSNHCTIEDDQGRIHNLVRGSDGALWDNVDGAWTCMGGFILSAPFAARDRLGRIHVFCVGSDDAVWDYILDTVTMSGGWISLGGSVLSIPAAAMEPTYGNCMKVVAIGSDHGLWLSDLDINSLSNDWHNLGGYVSSSPFVIFDEGSRLHIFILDFDNSLWDNRGVLNPEGSYVHDWHYLGGNIKGNPTATLEPGYSNYLAVMVRGQDDCLWMNDVHASASPVTGRWRSFGGIISASPTVYSDTSGRIHAFVRGGDESLWENVFSSSPWNPGGAQWYRQGGAIVASPTACLNGITYVCVQGVDGAIWCEHYLTSVALAAEAGSSEKVETPGELAQMVEGGTGASMA